MSDSRGWVTVSMSDAVYWTIEPKPRGCWKCRLRVLLRWPRPYRHFGCGPSDPFPDSIPLADLLALEDEL